MSLKKELETYHKHIAELVQSSGKYVLIKGEAIEGTFDSYTDALKAGYAKHGLEEFLVKQIAPAEKVMSFTRSYDFACQQ